jgi:hypothetical protein
MPDTIEQFAKRIKEKYADYQDVDDYELVERIVRKNPTYASQVELPQDFRLLATTSGYPDIDDLYEKAGREHNVDPNLLLEQARKETAFDPDVFYGRRGSSAGAKGSGQFIPSTANRFSVDVNDPISGINGQAKYMRELLDMFDNDEDLALAGYNAGEHRKSLKAGKIPPFPETQDYVKTIRENLTKVRESSTGVLRKLVPTTPTFPTVAPPIVPIEAFQKPVPETAGTIEEQVRSALDANSPRAGVLLTEPDQIKLLDPATVKPFKMVPMPNGQTLLVNETKAKALGITDYQKDAAKIMAKAVDVGNSTATGPTVLTTLPDGTEAASSIAPTPEAAQAQVGLDQAAHPGSTSQVVGAQDVVKKRQADLQKQYEAWLEGRPSSPTTLNEFNAMLKARNEQEQSVGELGRIGESIAKGQLSPDVDYRRYIAENKLPDSAESVLLFNADVNRRNAEAKAKAEAVGQTTAASTPHAKQTAPKYTHADFKAWAQFNKVPTTAQNRQRFEAELTKADKDQYGKDSTISLNAKDFEVGETPVTSSEFRQVGSTVFHRKAATARDNQNAEIGTTQVDPTWSPEQKLREAMNAQLRRYDVSPQEIDQFLAGAGQADIAALSRKPDTEEIGISYKVLSQIKGADAGRNAIRTEQAEARTDPNIGIDLTADAAKTNEQFADWMNSEAGQAAALVNPLIGFLPTETRDKLAGSILGGAAGAGGRTLTAIGGIARMAEANARIYEGITGVKPTGKKMSEMLRELGEGSARAEANLGYRDNSWQSLIIKTAAAAPGDISRLMLLSRLPGGAIVGMAADAGLQSAGRGESLGQVAKHTAKGAVIGTLFRGAPLVGRIAAASPAVKSAAGKAIFNQAAQTATIGTGSVVVEKLFGSTDEQAVQAGVLNSLFHLSNVGMQLAGKVIRGRDGKGNEATVGVEPDGSVKLLKGQEAAKAKVDVEMYFNEKSKTWEPVGAERGPETAGEKTATVTPDQQGGYARETKGLLGEQSPQRIETADPKAVEKATIDTGVGKVVEALKKQTGFVDVDTLAKSVRMNRSKLEDAVMTLYGAKVIEILPGNRIRLIGDLPKTDLFEKAKTYGQKTEVPPQPAPLAETPAVPPSDVPAPTAPEAQPVAQPVAETSKPAIDAAKYKGQTVTNPQTREQITFTGELSENGTLIGTNPQGRERRAASVDVDRWLAAQANAPVAEPPTQDVGPQTATPEPETQLQPAPEAKPEPRPFKERGTGPRRPKTKYRDLTQFVRAAGGIKPNIRESRRGKRQGELQRLSPKETGTTGLINKNSQYDAELMAKIAYESGYLHDVFESIDHVNGDTFLEYLENDFTGVKKSYSREDMEDIFDKDFEAREEEYYKAKAEDPEAREEYARRQDEQLNRQIAFLNDPETQELLAKISEEAEYEGVNVKLSAELDRQFNDKLDQFGLDSYFDGQTILEGYREALAERESPSTESIGEFEPQEDNERVAEPAAAREVTPKTEPVKPIDADIVAQQVDDNADSFYEDEPAAAEAVWGDDVPYGGPRLTRPDGSWDAEAFDAKDKQLAQKVRDFRKNGGKTISQMRNATAIGMPVTDARDPRVTGTVISQTNFDDVQVQWTSPLGIETHGEFSWVRGKDQDELLVTGPRQDINQARSKAKKAALKAEKESAKEPKTEPKRPANRGISSVTPRPTLHGVPPQELTPLMHARVLYAREQGVTPADIAERYNLTPAQVESVGELPQVGSGGQMSHKLIKAMVPANQATEGEKAEKIAFANDLAAELGLTDIRLTRDTMGPEVKAASDVIRLAIANEMGRERGSHMTPGDWLKWMDVHGDRLSYDSIAALLDAFEHQSDHTENKVRPFVTDKRLEALRDEIDDKFGLDNIHNYRSLPKEIRTKIEVLGHGYGLKRTAIERAFTQTFLDLAREKFEAGRNERASGTDTPAGEAKPAEERSRGAEELGDSEALFSRMAPSKPFVSLAGNEFTTGKPITFDFIRNTEKAHRSPTDEFAQSIEPAGRFMLEKPSTFTGQKGWEDGTVTFQSPLVIEWGSGRYADADNWKQVLSQRYGGKKGKALSKAILADGYDGIVTTRSGDTSEIVDLTPIGEPKLPEPKNLVAVHNLSASKILFADKLGGIALPSIAVKNVEHEFSGYGDISLIASPDLIDPKRGTTVTDSDQYSPRYPSLQYKLKHPPVMKLWDDVVKVWKDNFGGEKSVPQYMQGSWDKSWYPLGQMESADGPVRFLESNEMFQGYFLAEKHPEFMKPPKGEDPWYHPRKAIHDNGLRDEFDEFVVDTIESLGGDPKFFSHWTYAGHKSLKDYTLDNVVKKLKSELKEGESFFYGSGNVRAKAAKRFRSIPAIQKDRDRLVQSMDDVKDEMNKRLLDLAEEYGKYNTRSGGSEYRLGDGDTFGKALAEGLAEKRLQKVLKEYGYEIPSDEMGPIHDYLDKLRAAPTEYFEAVPRRAVSLQEFTAAVIPDSTPQKVRDILKRKGLDIYEYKKSDEADRAQKVRQASEQNDILFSRTPAARTEAPRLAPNGKPSNLSPGLYEMVRTPAFKQWFGDWEKFATMKAGVWNDDKREVSKIVDENGEPKVVYHGTSQAGFPVFRGGQKVDGAFFFTDQRNMARTYSGTRDEATIAEDEAYFDNDYADETFDEAKLVNPHPGIYSAFLNIRNPYEEYFEGANWDGSRFDQYEVLDEDGEPVYNEEGRGYFSEEAAGALADLHPGSEVRPAGDFYSSTDHAARQGQEFGHDGAIMHSVIDSGSQGEHYDPATVYTVNHSSQIKSATQNRGSFSPDNPNILFGAQVDLFGGGVAPEKQPEQQSIFDMTIVEMESKEAKASNVADVLDKPTADYLTSLTNSPDKDIKKIANHIIANTSHDRKAVIDDAADALDIFARAKQTKTPVADMLRQGWIGQNVELSPRAQNFARAMESGQFQTALKLETAKGTEQSALFDRTISPLGFFSQLERTIDEKMPAKASAQQVKGIIKDTKQEERDWLGIDQWLDQNPNPTKQEVLDFVRANNVEIKEVEKGGIDSAQAFAEAEQWWNDEGGANEETPWDDLSQDEQIDAVQRYRDEVLEYTEENLDNGTKFDKYTLPGGENYRELLLTLPSGDKLADAYSVESNNGRNAHGTYPSKWAAEQAVKLLKKDHPTVTIRKIKESQPAEPFKSSHFDEPNILAHVRFDDRDGGKTLHIAEIQSDWHQAGRKKGYKRTDAAFQKELDAATKKKNLAEIKHGTESEEYKAAYAELLPLLDASNLAVPDAPFKKSWHELAMKRMLRYAVENGYERVTWDVGATQAERYDLSNQIESIFWNTYGHPTNKSVAITTPSEELIRVVIGKEDGIVKEGTESQNVPSEWVGKRLDDVVGKDLAEKIIASDEGQLEGEGLKTDAPGMKSFYDKMLPSFVSKYVKKWGGKVESGEISDSLTRSAPGQPGAAPIPVHSLTITPAMSESVMQGQPLFDKTQLEKLRRFVNRETRGKSMLQQLTDARFRFNPKNGLTEMNASALAMVHDIFRKKGIIGNEGGFLGAALPPREAEFLTNFMQTALDIAEKHAMPSETRQLRRLVQEINRGVHPDYKDLAVAFADPRFKDITDRTAEEELGHLADIRTKVNDTTPFEGADGYETAKQHLRGEDYQERLIHREILGKIQREDAAAALGITEAQVDGLRAIRDQQLFDAGITPERYLEAYGKISSVNQRRADKYARRFTQQTGTREYQPAQRSDDGSLFSNREGMRPRGDTARPTYAEGEQSGPDRSALRRAELLSASQRPNEGLTPQTETPAFKKWFGDSKVVDEKGEPLIVYHGTDSEFDIFDAEHISKSSGNSGNYGKGFYFAPSAALASRFGDKVIPAYVRLKNPYIYDQQGRADSFNEAHDVEAFTKELLDRGHDGVIVHSDLRDTDDDFITEVVAFSPTQIKSAIGNRGTFDPNDANILHSLISPAERRFIEKQAKGDTALARDVEDEVLFSRMADNKWTVGSVLIDLAAAPKSFKTAVDLSGLRQAGILSLSNPDIGAKAFVKQFKSFIPFYGEKFFERFKIGLNLHPIIELAEEVDLYLSSLRDQMSLQDREEAFMSRLFGPDPVFSNKTLELIRRNNPLVGAIRMSERAYVTMLDSVRIESFARLAKQLHNYNQRKGRKDDIEQYKALARAINYMTGRGGLGPFSQDFAPLINATIFSMRYWTSRLQLLNPMFYKNLPPGTRGIVIRQMVTFLGAVGILGALLKAAGAEIEWDDINDPSTLKIGFGKFKYDLGFGLLQHIQYAGKMMTAADDKKPADRMVYVTERYLRSKASPTAGASWNAITGTNYIGEPTSLKEEAVGLLVPISIENFTEAARAEGLPGFAKMTPEFFGISTTRYAEQKELQAQIAKERAKLTDSSTPAEKIEVVRRIKAWQKLIDRAQRFDAEDAKKAAAKK